MNSREVDLDELFDRSAETRLLDRRRSEELGLPPLATPPSPTPARFGPESIIGVPIASPRAAMLRVSLDARPNAELIPGAVVTVVAEVADDGDTDADEVLLRVALPLDCEPIAGSFARDGIELDGDALLGEGLRIGTVPAGGFVRVRFTLRVLPGTEALDVTAHAEAPGVPAIGGAPLMLRRRAGHAAFDAPRPFFELEAGEVDEELAETETAAEPLADHAVDTVVDEPVAPLVERPPVETAPVAETPPIVETAPVAEPEPPRPVLAAPPSFVITAAIAEPEPEPPVQAEPEPEASVQTEPEPPAARAAELPVPLPVTVEAEPPAPPEAKVRKPRRKSMRKPRTEPARSAQPEPEPAQVAQTYLLARVLDADEVRALERVFSGAVPHGLAALALLSSIAAVDAQLGRALGVSEFARSIASALPRALVAARMGRPTPSVVTPEALAAIRPAGEAPAEDTDYEGPLLVTRLEARELEALRTLLARDLEDPFLRGAQVLLAVAPRAVENVEPAATTAVRDALGAYRVAAGGWLMRVTVRRAVDRKYDPLTADDPTLHEAGRTVVAALREAVT